MVVTDDVCNGSEEFIIIGACTYYVIKHLYSTFLHKNMPKYGETLKLFFTE